MEKDRKMTGNSRCGNCMLCRHCDENERAMERGDSLEQW